MQCQPVSGLDWKDIWRGERYAPAPLTSLHWMMFPAMIFYITLWFCFLKISNESYRYLGKTKFLYLEMSRNYPILSAKRRKYAWMLFSDSVKFCNVCRIYNFGAIQRPRNEHFHYKDLRHSVWQHLDSLEKPQHETDSLTFKLDAQEVYSAHARWAVQCGSNAEDV